MLSRVADSLYWMSRYLERAEHTTRLLDVNLNLMLDESTSSADRRWPRLLQGLGRPRRLKWEGNPYTLAHTLTFDTTNPSSVVSCIISARENARHMREQISTEQWHRVNSLYLEVTRPGFKKEMTLEATSNSNDAPIAFLQQVMEAVHQFQGVTDSTMSHGEGWHFIQVGRFLERATATTLLLEAYNDDLWLQPERATDGNEYLEWMGLLRSATAFEAYCKVYTADLTPERIFEFLLLDPEFPHSLRFSINALQEALIAIQRQSGKRRADDLHRLAGKLASSLAFASVDEILDRDVIGYLRRIQQQCNAIHETIYQLYVNYSIQAALAG
ncbi:alpha-E domain-containing protein [Granulicella sp. 5B5]|uniref:alpha-E domain-containing protein n=1 Tax=Granulicella sp. 5B5 TaxID=1617967 RepID=UPI0015F3B54B|nr:alpha-E domain-containing protein [Granulicella sp. 5B5]QMV18474.1 alpha-E domain-containing protein [Granulicella sp. 5B5]